MSKPPFRTADSLMNHCITLGLVLMLLAGCAGRDVVTVEQPKGVAAQEAATALRSQIERVRMGTTNTAMQMQFTGLLTDATNQRTVLRWRLATEDVCLETLDHANVVVALAWLWHWQASGAAYLGRTDLGLSPAVQQAMHDHMTQQATASRDLAERFLGNKVAATLQAEIERSAASGEMFTMSSKQREGALLQVLSATRLEGVLGLAMSPFDAMSGVGKGADALDEGVRTAQQATELLGRYPQILSLQMQLGMLDLAEQPASRQVLSDSHDVVVQLRDLPTRLRTEAAALLADSATASSQLGNTLRDTKAAADAIAHAADAIEGSILALDAFVTNVQGPAKPATAPASAPFLITDYRDTATAIAQAAAQLRETIVALEHAATTPAIAAAQAQATAAVDHLAWRVAQLLVLAALLAAGLLWLRQRGRTKRTV